MRKHVFNSCFLDILVLLQYTFMSKFFQSIFFQQVDHLALQFPSLSRFSGVSGGNKSDEALCSVTQCGNHLSSTIF